MNYGRFLKNTLKNCQRDRAKMIINRHGSLVRSYCDGKINNRIRKYLNRELLQFGLIGSEYFISQIIIEHKKMNIKYKALFKIGRKAMREGKILSLRDIVMEYWRSKTKGENFDIRTVPFVKVSIGGYVIKPGNNYPKDLEPYF